MPKQEKKRIPVFIFPETHLRLNLLKSELSQEQGRIVFLDEAINTLIDGHVATEDARPTPDKRVRARRQLQPIPTP